MSIRRSMTSFWWGNGGDGRGIRWLAWDKLCDAKAGGGLGFRELNNFNVAMLAKQGWRLLNNENSLVTSIMKAKYFPHSDFLNATLGANPSFMWRSIMAGQNVVKDGSRRRIGDRKNISVGKSPWLSCQSNGYMTTNMPTKLEHVKVVNLMTDNGDEWDQAVLDNICNNRDKELIKRIPIPTQRTSDSWFWVS